MGERGKWVMGIEEGTCLDEHWVLNGNQFDNKFHIKKKKGHTSESRVKGTLSPIKLGKTLSFATVMTKKLGENYLEG